MTLHLQPGTNGKRLKTKGSWQPGQSGNPSGRRAEADGSPVELARRYAGDAIEALVVALRFKGERVPAAREILDRAYGRPTQTIAGEVNVNVLHLLAARLVSEELEHDPPAPVAVPPRITDVPTE
jgi:hypothetical protein